MHDDNLHGGVFDRVPDTNHDGKVDMRDYHSWMENEESDDTDSSGRASDDLSGILKLLLGILIVLRILTWIF